MEQLNISTSESTNVLTITNFKGGVGKTSIALNLAYELSRKGDSVLLIDMDPQGNLSHCLRAPSGQTLKSLSLANGRSIANVLEPDALGLEELNLAEVALPTAWPGVLAVPANLSLQRVKDAILTNSLTLHFAIQDSLDLLNKPKWVIIDTHPDLDMKVTNAIVAAQRILIPVCFDGSFYEGLKETMDAVEKTCGALHLAPKACRVIPVKVDMRTGKDQAGKNALESLVPQHKLFGELFLRNTVKVGEASMRCLAVRELYSEEDKNKNGIVDEYEKLADEITKWFSR